MDTGGSFPISSAHASSRVVGPRPHLIPPTDARRLQCFSTHEKLCTHRGVSSPARLWLVRGREEAVLGLDVPGLDVPVRGRVAAVLGRDENRDPKDPTVDAREANRGGPFYNVSMCGRLKLTQTTGRPSMSWKKRNVTCIKSHRVVHSLVIVHA